MMNKKDVNKVKKRLGIRKDNLILMKTYMIFGVEFVKQEDAVEYVLDQIKRIPTP